MKMNPTLLGFFKKELIQTLRDPRMRIMLFVMPIIQMTVFGVAISTETRNIKLAAQYEPNDTITRRVVERCYSSKWFIPAKGLRGADPFRWIQSGQADAVLVAPEKGVTRAVGRALQPGSGQGGANLQLLIDSSNITKAEAIESYTQATLNQVLGEAFPDTKLNPPVRFVVRYLYNPEMVTSVFMVPSVLCMILLMVTMILSSSSMAREKEMGTLETLLSSPATTTEIMLGKSLPFVLLGMIEFPVVISVAVFGFGVPMRGSFLVLMACALIFMCNAVALGILLSTFVKNLQQSAMAGFLFIFPAIQLSGVLYPVENMPWLLKYCAYFDPIMYFVNLLRNIMLKGGDFQVVAFNAGALVVMAFFAIGIASKRFHQTLN
jgi:ABC-2 type transport system permease protein